MVNKMIAMVPVNNHMVPVNNHMVLDNNHMVPDNKRATIMAPVNKATDLVNKAVMIIALVNKAAMIIALVNKAVMIIALVSKDLVTMVQDLKVVNLINQKLQATVPAMITLKVAAAALNTEEQALPMILMDPETPTTRVTDLVSKVAAAMDLAKKLTIMDLAIRAVMLVMDNSNMEANKVDNSNMEANKVDNSNMEANKVDNRVMEIKVDNRVMEIKVNRVEGMMTIIEEYA